MRKLAPILVLLTALPALAVFSVGGRVGYLAPMGEYSDYFEGGLTGGFSFGLGLIPLIDVTFNVDYVESAFKPEEVDGVEVLSDHYNTIIPIYLQGKLKLPGIISPFVVGGVGLYYYDFQFTDADENEFEDKGLKWGFNTGLGAEVGFLGFMGAYADATYHWTESDLSDISCLTLRAGFYFGF